MKQLNKLNYKFELIKDIAIRHLKERFHKKLPAKDPQRILIAAKFLLGDFVMLVPLIQAVKKKYPKAGISLLIPKPFISLAKTITEVDELIEINEKNADWLKKIKKEHPLSWDIGILPFQTAYTPLFYALGVKSIISFPDPKGRYRKLIHQAVPIPNKAEHLSLLMLQLLTDHPISAEDLKQTYFNLIETSSPVSLPTRYIVIHPGAGGKTRLWPAKNYAFIADQLAKAGYWIVFTGSKAEVPLIEDITKNMSSTHFLSMAGQTDLLNFALILQEAQLVLGPDTGALHLARAVDTWSIALMGSAQSELYGPHEKLHNLKKSKFLYIDHLTCRDKKTVFQHAIPGVHNCTRPSCPYAEHPCMNNISPEKVLTTIQEFPHMHLSTRDPELL